MSTPKDHNAESTVGAIRTARIFSNLVSPPVIFACLGLALAWHELPFWQGLLWASIYGFCVSLFPIIFVAHRLRTGQISDLHMNTTQERRLPYLVSVAGSISAILLVIIFNGPTLLLCLSVFSAIELGLMAIINDFWKISIHAASIAAASVIVGLVYGPAYGLLLVPLVALVSWVRLYLRRHTLSQVTAGLMVGSTVPLLLSRLGCFS
jgi:membrane-associated phospholipid phosphatase